MVKEQEFKEVEKTEAGRMLEVITDWLDTRFTLPGTKIRFGLDAIIGIIPGGGNIFTSIVSVGLFGFIIVRGVPFMIALKMVGNILMDFFLSAIPLLGIVFDVGYKSNLWNLQLLEKHLKKREPGKYYYGAWVLFGLLLLILIILSFILLHYIAVLLNWIIEMYS